MSPLQNLLADSRSEENKFEAPLCIFNEMLEPNNDDAVPVASSPSLKNNVRRVDDKEMGENNAILVEFSNSNEESKRIPFNQMSDIRADSLQHQCKLNIPNGVNLIRLELKNTVDKPLASIKFVMEFTQTNPA